MALLEALLGASNPLARWANQNSNTLTGLGASLLNDGMNFTPLQQGRALDQKAAQDQKAEQQKMAQNEVFKTWLSKTRPDLVPLLDAGVGSGDLFNQALKQPDTPNLPNEYELFQLSQQDPAFAEYLKGQKSTGSLPTSFQEWQLAQQNPEYAASLNSTTTRVTEGQRRNDQLAAVAGPQADIVLQNWADLTNPQNQMLGANINGGSPGLAMTSPGYQRAAGALKTLAQSYLYSVSGAAATDAETQKIVDSVTPKFGESEQSANDKKALIQRMVKAIEDAGSKGGAAPDPVAPGDEIDSILSGLGI